MAFQRLFSGNAIQMIELGMRILFVAPKFFGYEKLIKEELERLGCRVDWHDDRPASTALVKALIRFRPELVSYMSKNYFDHIIDDSRGKNYDVVFVIKGEALSVERLQRFRHYQPKAQFLYYTWDSLKNFKDSREKLECFDKVYSFDRFDSLTNSKVKHLPLFYVRVYEELTKSSLKDIVQDIDLLFLGSIHSDRYAVVKRIFNAAKQSLPNISTYAYFFYQSKWVFTLRKLVDSRFMSIPWRSIKWQSLNLKKTFAFISRSRILVDVHHLGQTGLTMRTIESLGAQKKLITTNADVINYDFYCPENICVVDRIYPVVPTSFLRIPYQALPSEIYYKYSLHFWLNEIFGFNFSGGVTSSFSAKIKASTKSPMKVLVTGANGFVGTALCDALIRDGHNVLGTVRQSSDNLLQRTNIKYLSLGEIDEFTDWSAALNGVEVVIHVAARAHVMQDSTLNSLAEFRKINSQGTEHLARSAAQSGVKRFVFISSIKVNGEETQGCKKFTEEDERSPRDSYSVSKSEAELALQLVAKETGLEVTIIRPPLVYGPNVKANFLNLLYWIDYGIPLPVKLIKNKRSLIFIGNLVDALITCATHPEAANKIYLVSDGEDVSTRQLICYIAGALNRQDRVFSFPVTLMHILAKLVGKLAEIDRLTQSLVVDNSKIQRELGWQPPYTMAQGLQATAEWYHQPAKSERA